jgi:hypothetical protein
MKFKFRIPGFSEVTKSKLRSGDEKGSVKSELPETPEQLAKHVDTLRKEQVGITQKDIDADAQRRGEQSLRLREEEERRAAAKKEEDERRERMRREEEALRERIQKPPTET